MKSRNEQRYAGKIALVNSYIMVFILGFAAAYLVFNMQVFDMSFGAPKAENFLPLPQEIASASANIVAVSSADNSGVVGRVDVQIRPSELAAKTGKVRVLINTNPFTGIGPQESAETGVKIAESLSGKSLADRDVVFSFDVPAQVIDGPSAGAAMTVAVIAAIESKHVREDAAMTGTIEEDGSINRIGGIIEKAQAAGENNLTLFLVPAGQTRGTYYERQIQESRRGGFVFQRVVYAPKTFELGNYTMENYNMETKEVATIEEAVRLMVK